MQCELSQNNRPLYEMLSLGSFPGRFDKHQKHCSGIKFISQECSLKVNMNFKLQACRYNLIAGRCAFWQFCCWFSKILTGWLKYHITERIVLRDNVKTNLHKSVCALIRCLIFRKLSCATNSCNDFCNHQFCLRN